MNDHDTLLGPALRDRLRSEQPDLERLAAVALRTGTRLRRRRTATLVAGTAAAIAGIGLGGALLSGGGSGSTGAVDEPDLVASGPAAPGLTVGQVLDLGDGLSGAVTADATGIYVMGSSTRPGEGTGLVVVVSGPVDRIEAFWSEGFGSLLTDWPGITVAISTTDAESLGMLGSVDRPPVTVGAGWTCEWFLVDDKAACTAPDGGVASLAIRDAADRASWLGSTDKGDDPSVFATQAHDGIFLTVQGGRGTTEDEIRELGASLRWVD